MYYLRTLYFPSKVCGQYDAFIFQLIKNDSKYFHYVAKDIHIK